MSTTSTTASSATGAPRKINFEVMNTFSAQIITVTVGLLLPVLSWLLYAQTNTNPIFPLMNDAQLTANLRGKDTLVIGGTEGIGAAIANELAKHGASLTVTGAAVDNQMYLPRGSEFIRSNISTLRGAQELGSQLLRGRQFDTVLFVGGFVPRPLIFKMAEGYEEDLHTSYLSRFIILQELIKNDAFVGRKRAYILAYPGDDRMMASFEDMWFDWTDYKDIPSWLNTVLFNDALVKEAARRHPELRIFGVNPGFVTRDGASGIQWSEKSLLMRALERLLTIGVKSPEYYARHSLVQIVASPDLEFKSGAYINDKCEELPPKRWMSKEVNRMQVWDNSVKIVQKALG